LPPTPTLPKAKFQIPKILYFALGLMVILVTIALAISLFAKVRPSGTGSTATNGSGSGTAAVIDGWTTYTNAEGFYSLQTAPKWLHITVDPLDKTGAYFDTSASALLQVKVEKVSSDSLDAYLTALDQSRATAWDGKAAAKVTKSTVVKVGEYDGLERQENWSATGTQAYVTYAQIQDYLYTFSLVPTGGKNAVTSETVIREYRQALSTFHLTSLAQLGQDWKTYTSSEVIGLSFTPFTLSYPPTWTLTEDKKEGSTTISLYRNNYELSITRAAVGNAVCLFKDSPAFEGSSGDLRSKEYLEMTTKGGSILRRYFNANQGEKSTMFFCEKQSSGPYFVTPLTIGGLVYTVPAKYDADIIKEMDEIVKTLEPVTASPSAAPTQ
jgi:hypothetical protein